MERLRTSVGDTSVGGTPVWDNPSSTDGAKFVSAPAGGKTPEEKLAKKILDVAGHMNFSVSLFTYALVAGARGAMQERLLDIARGIIKDLSMHHRVNPTVHTDKARRMHDKIGSL